MSIQGLDATIASELNYIRTQSRKARKEKYFRISI
jgi:hypothetical protein